MRPQTLRGNRIGWLCTPHAPKYCIESEGRVGRIGDDLHVTDESEPQLASFFRQHCRNDPAHATILAVQGRAGRNLISAPCRGSTVARLAQRAPSGN
jgi:hypothetical protein